MDRDFRRGHLEIDFPVQPFGSAPSLLASSVKVFCANFGFVAGVTLAVFLPGKAALQLVCAALDISPEGIVSYLVSDFSDLILGSLVAPAIIYGLVERFRAEPTPPFGECLRWGRRVWGKMLWNRFKVEITVALWSLLLFVPGFIAMVKLALVDPIVAVEADGEAEPLARSRELTHGRRWRIFGVLAPLVVLEFAGSWAVLAAFKAAGSSRAVMAVGESVAAVVVQGLTTVAVLLAYLGVVEVQRPVKSRAR
jgi:hypothetical protein